jgi:RNA polymerase sigma-70 factor (ECF subfamily)
MVIVAERHAEAAHDAELTELAAALAGDEDAFRELTEPYSRELHLHCYRLLGSFHDAEDAVQETMVRAWRHLGTFEGRSGFRTWLYRIATNVCLTLRRRPRPEVASLPQAIVEAVRSSTEPAIRLTPYPDALLDELAATSGDPVAEAELRESVQLAFLATVQLLPPRQRAALILRDVVGFPADDVADMLESTTASVNSALNRARATLQQQRASGRLHDKRVPAPDDVAASVARRYGEAWQAMDVGKLIGLLKQDVVLTMPPLPLRITGTRAVTEFFNSLPLAGTERTRVIPTRANRQPALAIYRRDSGEDEFQAWGIWVLTMDGDAIAEIAAFVDPPLLRWFGLPDRVGLA